VQQEPLGVEGVLVEGVVGVVVAGVEVVGTGVVAGAVASVVGKVVADENVTCVWRICTEEKNHARLRAEVPLIWERLMRKPSAAGRNA
jgi:alanine dehydrogenase